MSIVLSAAVELFPTREEAEVVVRSWDPDEPDQAGELHVEEIALEAGTSS